MTAPQAAFAQIPNSLLPHNLSPWGMFLNADIVVKAKLAMEPKDMVELPAAK